MEHWKNMSLDCLEQEYEGIVYKEEWRDIIGYEGHYRISSFGRVKSLGRRIPHRGRLITLYEKIKKLQMGTTGYPIIILYNNKNSKNCKVHRITGFHFIDNPDNLPEINHKDGIKTNGFYLNLEWNTPSQNELHAYRTGLKISRKGRQINTAVLTEGEVLEIRRLQNRFLPKELCKMFNMSEGAIYAIIQGRSWKHLLK